MDHFAGLDVSVKETSVCNQAAAIAASFFRFLRWRKRKGRA